MDEVVSPSPDRRLATLLMAIAAIAVVVYVALPNETRTQSLGSAAMTLATTAIGALALWRAGKTTAWPGARHLAATLGLLTIAVGVFLLYELIRPGDYEPRVLDLVVIGFLFPMSLAARDELRAHFEARDRREVAMDVGLLTVAFAAIAFVFMVPAGADASATWSAAGFSIVAAGAFTMFGAIALWSSTTAHTLQFMAFAGYGVATLAFGADWTHGTFDGTSLPVDLPLLVCPLLLAATVVGMSHGSARPVPRIARPVLTSAATLTAAAALAIVAIVDDNHGIAGWRSSIVLALLGLGVAARILANQVASAQAHAEAQEALSHREGALHEADLALDTVRDVNETLRRSEEHLRLVFDTAVDGIVEIDDGGLVIRANDAFARMVGLDRRSIEGQSWSALAASIDGADPGFASLPLTGQAQIRRTEGQPLFLESRVSEVPTQPPRRLLLVRDVTSAKVADQTIRSLFQFLQDRDEDRTRLLRRTNAAIESERNRIARDLHDGPVQGVSAASLSLEAALLMIKGGDTRRGLEILAKIRGELAGEADGLRRLMSGLRPPVLEERGLMPALRETLSRFESDNAIVTSFTGSLERPLPDDLETLAYRVVQEALTNAGKHAGATQVNVHVESDATQLRIEVGDDGGGFDPAKAREFLHMGRVGLASMRERVELASGTFAVRSTPGRGTTVMATLPLDTSVVIVGP